MNKNNQIKFKDGTRVKNVEKAKYLGARLTRNANVHEEVNNRIVSTLKTMKSLQCFWNKAHCPVKWKLQVYNSVIISKLTYALETVQLTKALEDKLDAFQIKGIRQIFKKYHRHL